MFTRVRARWAGVRGKVGLGAAMSGASDSAGRRGDRCPKVAVWPDPIERKC